VKSVVEFVFVYARVDELSSLALSVQESSVGLYLHVARGLPISCRALLNVDLSGGHVTVIDLIAVTFIFLCQ